MTNGNATAARSIPAPTMPTLTVPADAVTFPDRWLAPLPTPARHYVRQTRRGAETSEFTPGTGTGYAVPLDDDWIGPCDSLDGHLRRFLGLITQPDGTIYAFVRYLQTSDPRSGVGTLTGGAEAFHADGKWRQATPPFQHWRAVTARDAVTRLAPTVLDYAYDWCDSGDDDEPPWVWYSAVLGLAALDLLAGQDPDRFRAELLLLALEHPVAAEFYSAYAPELLQHLRTRPTVQPATAAFGDTELVTCRLGSLT